MKNGTLYQRIAGILILCTLLSSALMVSPAQAEKLPPDELLTMAEDVAERASQLAIRAKETNDYYQAQHAFALAGEAACWVFEVFGIAQNTADPKLAFAAQNAAKGIVEAIILSRAAAQEIAASDPDPDVAHAVNFLLESSEFLLLQIKSPP
jgi:hypothetical protein